MALKQRYSQRIEQRLGKIDLAFAKYWRLDEAKNAKIERQLDAVEDVRRKLHKRLEDCSNVIGQLFGQNGNDQNVSSARDFFESGVKLEDGN